MSVTGNARRDGAAVEVLPGGALRSLELTPEALRGGGATLARTIMALVREATAQANERVKNALADDFAGLRADEFAALGLISEEELTETAESTTPDSWRV